MDREIKFRAWHKSSKRMIYDIQNEFEERIELGMDCFADYLKNDDFVVEQYTEFNDKNNKEIYEGDIVRCTNGDDEIEGTNTGLGVIEWVQDCGFWNVSNIENGIFDIIQENYIEVIGNIHENPELLEAEK